MLGDRHPAEFGPRYWKSESYRKNIKFGHWKFLSFRFFFAFKEKQIMKKNVFCLTPSKDIYPHIYGGHIYKYIAWYMYVRDCRLRKLPTLFFFQFNFLLRNINKIFISVFSQFPRYLIFHFLKILMTTKKSNIIKWFENNMFTLRFEYFYYFTT